MARSANEFLCTRLLWAIFQNAWLMADLDEFLGVGRQDLRDVSDRLLAASDAVLAQPSGARKPPVELSYSFRHSTKSISLYNHSPGAVSASDIVRE